MTTQKTLLGLSIKHNATLSRIASEILGGMNGWNHTPALKASDKRGLRKRAAAYRARQTRQTAAGYRNLPPCFRPQLP